MPISFACPRCNKPLEAPDSMAGREAVCPSCKNKIIVPEQKQQKKKS